MLELRDPQLQLVPLLARHEAELAREILHLALGSLAHAKRVAAPARAEVVEDRAELVEPRPNRLVVFEVSELSLHQVREVMSGLRLSLAGWFYT